MVTEGDAGAEGEWHSYRCPVCGHRDEVRTDPGGERTISCSHCETVLKVVAGSTDDPGVTVQVEKP